MDYQQPARRGTPAPEAITDRESGVSYPVRQLTHSLAGRMNAQNACRIVIGLIYLRNKARTPSLDTRTGHDTWAIHEKPSWNWLLAQAQKPQPLGPQVRLCLSAWLPQVLGADDADAVRDFMPRLHGTVDQQLRDLVRAIDQVDRVGDLLEQCLQDLSAAQAKGGHYFTPRDIVRLMVEAVAPQDGQHVFDPVCGSAGLLAEAERHVRERTGLQPNLTLTGRDLHADTLQIARLNLAARGVQADLGMPMDSLATPTSETYDIVVSNPPFNMTPWATRPPHMHDPRWLDGSAPPRDNANFAWILHIAHALAPQGRAAILMADGAATGARPGEQSLRERLVRHDLIECVVALPPGLFPHVKIPCCLWLLNRDKSPHRGWGSADRRGDVLFVNARRTAELVPGTRRWRLAADGTKEILRTLAAWRGVEPTGLDAGGRYQDEPGWCVSLKAEEIAKGGYGLLPVVHASEWADEHTAADERVEELKWELYDKFEEAHALERDLRRILDEL